MSVHSEERIASRLQWIRDRKREGVEGVFKATALALPLPPSLHDALRVPRADRALVVELCRCPNGPGTTPIDIEVGALASRLEALGATALAICPDENWSGCNYQDILSAAQATSLPILARDPILDPIQIVMARAHGAAAIVVDPSMVQEREFRMLIMTALEYGLDVVLEVRTARDLELGMSVRRGSGDNGSARVVAVDGVQNGKFDTFNYERLAPGVPEHAIRLAASGVRTAGEIAALENLGYDAFVVRMDVLGADPTAQMQALAGEAR
jgi:indole-3-glycerol phosphate synthase